MQWQQNPHFGDQDQTSHPHPLLPTVIPSIPRSFLAVSPFMPSHLTPSISCNSSVFSGWCRIMTCHVSSCLRMWYLFMCLCARVYFLHPTPPTISADHLLAAFFLHPLFVSSFSFGTLPLRDTEKTVWMSYVIAPIAVALRYHVWSQVAQRLMWRCDSLFFFFLELMDLINCLHFINQGPCFYCQSCSYRETELISFSCCCLALSRILSPIQLLLTSLWGR